MSMFVSGHVLQTPPCSCQPTHGSIGKSLGLTYPVDNLLESLSKTATVRVNVELPSYYRPQVSSFRNLALTINNYKKQFSGCNSLQ